MAVRLNDLENFLALSSCRSLSEGARKRGITQPSLSESIQRLERDLGCALIYRARSGISLTASGRLLVDRGRRVTEALDEIQDLGGAGEGDPTQRGKEVPSRLFRGRCVSIGCHQAVACYALPEALAALSRSAPDFRVALVHDFSRVIQSEIQSGRIDVGLIVNPVPVPDLVIRELATDVVAVWAAGKGTTQRRLICDPNLFQVQSILRRWKGRPSELVPTASLELIARLCQRGLGYGVIPERALSLTGVRLRRVPATPSYKDVLSLVHRPEFGRLPYERAVLDALASALA